MGQRIPPTTTLNITRSSNLCRFMAQLLRPASIGPGTLHRRTTRATHAAPRLKNMLFSAPCPPPIASPRIHRPMLTRLLKAKIHRATVTQTDVNYHGSITIDSELLRATGLLPNEMVLVADCENGSRFETYIIPGQAGSGVIGVNGAAARLTQVGHKVI